MPIKKGSISHYPARMSSVYRGAKLVWQNGEISTVTGISPLILSKALSKPIRSLTQFGKCEQRDPDVPPQYQRTEYNASDATDGYVNTGIVINSIDTEVEVDFQFTATPSAASPAMVWGFMGNSSNLPRWGFGAYGGKWLGSVNQTAADGYFDTSRHKAVMRVYMDGENPMWDGTLDGVELYTAASLPNPTLFTNNTLPVFLFARNNSGTAGNFAPAKIYAFKVRKAGVLINNLVPCKKGTTVGFYDTVTGAFLAGAGTLTAGADAVPSPSTPVDIVCNNGVLRAGNIIDNTPDGQGTFISPLPSTTNRIYKAFPSLIVGRSYTVSVTGTGWQIIVQRKVPDAPTGTNLSGWVTTYDFTPEDGYVYGIAIRKGDTAITPADFDGTLSLTVTDGGYWVDGTPEVLTVSGKNLYNKADGALKGYPSATGTWNGRSGDTSELSIIVTLEEGKTYTAQRASGGNCSFRVMGSANRPLEQGQSLMVISSPSSITDDVTTFTVPSGYPHIVFYVRNNAGTSLTTEDVVNAFQVELGSEATAYEPYVQPQTVTDIPMLLSVGDYKDEAELISGLLTHKVGVKVLTGDNAKDGLWGTSGGASNLYSLTIADSSTSNTFSPISTHFVGVLGSVGYASIQDGQFKHGSNTNAYYFKDTSSADVTAFKAKLATQLAVGTPVIVIYPLATETTEQTTPHALHTVSGTTIVDAQTNVDPVELSVTYLKKGGSAA